MQAIQIALAMTAGAGDEVVIPTPTWPNAAAAVGILGARAGRGADDLRQCGWSLDLERARCGGHAAHAARSFWCRRRIPTGWTASHDELRAMLALARQHGLWIVADETYARFWYGDGDARAVLSRRDGAGRPRAVRQHFLQELGDDRLAHRLDQGASVARAR